MTSEAPCLVCGRTKNTLLDRLGVGSGPTYRCDVCGWYSPSVDFAQYVTLSDADRPLLSAAIRALEEKEGQPRLFVLNADAYRKIIAAPSRSVDDKLNLLLRALGRLCKHPGGAVRIDPEVDYPLIYATSPTEIYAYLKHAESLGLIDMGRRVTEGVDCQLTIPGWERLEPLPQVGGEPGTCFVAMWFSSTLDDIYETAIRPAIEDDNKYKAVRIDRVPHNRQITDEIMAKIRSCEFMVADFTGQRAGVYYEAGFARGLGREVIYTCRETSFKRRHFDTSVMNHLVWKDAADLRKKLADHIGATILRKA